MTSAVMGSVPTRHAGIASAATNTTRELGGAVGIAILGAIVTSSARRTVYSRLVTAGIPAPEAAALAPKLKGAPAGVAPVITRPVAEGVHAAFVHAIHVGKAVSACVILLASVVSAVFYPQPRRKRRGGAGGPRLTAGVDTGWTMPGAAEPAFAGAAQRPSDPA